MTYRSHSPLLIHATLTELAHIEYEMYLKAGLAVLTVASALVANAFCLSAPHILSSSSSSVAAAAEQEDGIEWTIKLSRR